MAWRRSGALLLAGGAAFAATSTALALNDNYSPRWIHDRLPSRAEQLHRLSQGTAANPYDVLIIGGELPAEVQIAGLVAQGARRCLAAGGADGGFAAAALLSLSSLPACLSAGGATGTGCAVDAVTR